MKGWQHIAPSYESVHASRIYQSGISTVASSTKSWSRTFLALASQDSFSTTLVVR
jgi:hypothetical protein